MNNNFTALQLVSQGPASPVDQVNDRLTSLLTNLKEPLEQLSKLTATIKNIGSLINNGSIPVGLIPTCWLGITKSRPKTSKIPETNVSMNVANNLQLFYLHTYHNTYHDKLHTLINEKIQKEFDNIVTEFQGKVPEQTSKLNHTKTEITKLQSEIQTKCDKNRKRGSSPEPTESKNQNKKQKLDPTSSEIQQQVKSAIKEALGNYSIPFRS